MIYIITFQTQLYRKVEKKKWTGLDWTGLQSSEGHFLGRVHMESSGVQWCPYGLWGGLQSTVNKILR